MIHPKNGEKGLEILSAEIAPSPGSACERLIELDALRGLAASAVALGHFWELWDWENWPRWRQIICTYTPFYFVTAGHEAVILFFLLSGFVLSLPYIRGNGPSYGVFVIKRIFRIYVPYVVVISFAILCASSFHGMQAFNQWFRNTWSGPIDPHVVLQHFLFLGIYDTAQYDAPIWTLVYEMRISLVFPLVCFLVLRLPTWAAVLFGPLLSIIDHEFRSWQIFPSSPFILHYIEMFVVGIVIASRRKEIRNWVNSLSSVWFIILFLLAFTCMMPAHFMPATKTTIADWLIEMGAGGLIILSLGENGFSRFLRKPIPQFLGHISYSLYLIHSIIMYLLIYNFYPRFPVYWLFIPYVLLTIPLSVIFYRCVELPSMEAGRRISRWLG